MERETIKKKDLIGLIAEKLCSSKKDAEKALDAVLDAIKDSLASGKDVDIHSELSFKVVKTSARTGRNPQTGEEISIPEGHRVTVKCKKNFKETIKNIG